MHSLPQILDSFDPDADFTPPPNWLQGRTAYGGLVAALALRAAQRAAGAERPPLLTAHISFLAPAAHALRFRAQQLRRGKSSLAMAVDCFSDGDFAARATFVFAGTRTSAIEHELSRAPETGTPSDYAPLPDVPMLPAFLSNFDVRFVGPSLPVSGAEHPELLAWVRLHDAAGVDPAVALLALGDALPPAAMASFKTFAPVSSMTWTVDFARAAAAGEWFLMRSSSQRAAHGYSYQTMEIWDAAGLPVLAGSQTVAIFA